MDTDDLKKLIVIIPKWVLIVVVFYFCALSGVALYKEKYTISFWPPSLVLIPPPEGSDSEEIQERITETINDCILPKGPISRGAPFWLDNRWFVAGPTTVGKKPRTGVFYLLGASREEIQTTHYTINSKTPFIINGNNYYFLATRIEDAWLIGEIASEGKSCN